MKKKVLLVLILAVIGGAAYSFDGHSFPKPIGKGSVLISPTFNLGTYSLVGASLGPTLAIDGALPVNVAIMVGGEIGAIFLVSRWSPLVSDFLPISMPIFARVSWHPNFEVRGLDPYIRFKIGGNVAFVRSSRWTGGGVAVGVNAGVRYFFNNTIGIFGEFGYDYYGISSGRSRRSGYGYGYSGYYGYGLGLNSWFHTGITFKAGGQSSGGGSKSSSGSASKGKGNASKDKGSKDKGSASKGKATVTANVNFRAEPSANAKVIKQIPKDSTVTLTGKTSGSWTQITYKGDTGWVSSQYIKKK